MKSQSYNTFWQKIHNSAKEKGLPLRLMFELTYRCNFRCKHCYVPQSYRKAGELKTKDVFSILDQLADIGCFYLGFTGGEPFMREDIIKILWYAKRKGFEIIIYTNGSLIDKNIAEELSRLRPNKVDITIPAMSKEAFECITGVFGSHNRVFDVIDLLHRKEINLGFKSCVLKENESEISKIQDFAHFLGAQHRLDDMLLPRLDGSKEPYRYRGKFGSLGSLESSEQCDLANSTNSINSTNSMNSMNSNELFKCGVGKTQAAITPLGELKMCLMIDYPKYKILDTEDRRQRTQDRGQKTNLQDAWEELKELVSSIKPDKDYKCDKCELEPYCKWCPAQGWLENRSFTSCDSESRFRAKARRFL